MADVVIRGMEMPKGDPKEPTAVWIYPNGYVRVFAEIGNNVHSAEAIPLPEGHGRLIDADALMSDFVKARWKFFSDGDTFLQLLKHAPTIVPAEGGTDNV